MISIEVLPLSKKQKKTDHGGSSPKRCKRILNMKFHRNLSLLEFLKMSPFRGEYSPLVGKFPHGGSSLQTLQLVCIPWGISPPRGGEGDIFKILDFDEI